MVASPVLVKSDRWIIRKLKLTEKLSRSLDAREIVHWFYEELRRDIPISSICYQREAIDLVVRLGQQGESRLDFTLQHLGQSLGEVTLSRARPFTPREIEHVRELIKSMYYPLRNAGMYQLALRSAYQDPLTQVMNRASMEQALPREIGLAQRHGAPLALLVIDVDYFKAINDTHGHLVGDQVLCKVAQIIQDCLRSTDLVYRYGGDEFVVCLPSTPLESAVEVADRIRLTACSADMGVDIKMGLTIGATNIGPSCTLKSAFERADNALFEAKRRGRNCVQSIALEAAATEI
ncbi:MAG: GGDEF domain-containing protein [Granulosicoccaceae bacterium]